MADSKKNRGKADRSRVSGSQRSEVAYVARKYGVMRLLHSLSGMTIREKL